IEGLCEFECPLGTEPIEPVGMSLQFREVVQLRGLRALCLRFQRTDVSFANASPLDNHFCLFTIWVEAGSRLLAGSGLVFFREFLFGCAKPQASVGNVRFPV